LHKFEGGPKSQWGPRNVNILGPLGPHSHGGPQKERNAQAFILVNNYYFYVPVF